MKSESSNAEMYCIEKPQLNQFMETVSTNPKESIETERSISSYASPIRKQESIPVSLFLVLAFVLCVIAGVIGYFCYSTGYQSGRNVGSGIDTVNPLYSVNYETRYVGSINSNLIHYDTCYHAENIQGKNRVYYKNLSDAIADGRIRCSTCFSATSFSESSENSSVPSEKSNTNTFTQRYLERRQKRLENPPPFIEFSMPWDQ